jgi:diphosphomevalonate decarboxylase
MFRTPATPQYKATARAGSNIAFIKYWGVANPRLNLPLNNSISMTLGSLHTTTTVEWDTAGRLTADEIAIDGERAETGKKPPSASRSTSLGSATWRDRRRPGARRQPQQLPDGVGHRQFLGQRFAALTVAGCAALNLNFDRTKLSALARRGSGSASRSLFGGYVEWERGNDDATSVARQIFPPTIGICVDVVAMVSTAEKAVSSQSGHTLAMSSPFNAGRIDSLYSALQEVRTAIATRDLTRLGPVIEQDALAMHAVMMTSAQPALLAAGHARSDAGRAPLA